MPAAAEADPGAAGEIECAPVGVTNLKIALDPQRSILFHRDLRQVFLLMKGRNQLLNELLLLKEYLARQHEDQDAEKKQRDGSVKRHALAPLQVPPARCKRLGSREHDHMQSQQNHH